MRRCRNHRLMAYHTLYQLSSFSYSMRASDLCRTRFLGLFFRLCGGFSGAFLRRRHACGFRALCCGFRRLFCGLRRSTLGLDRLPRRGFFRGFIRRCRLLCRRFHGLFRRRFLGGLFLCRSGGARPRRFLRHRLYGLLLRRGFCRRVLLGRRLLRCFALGLLLRRDRARLSVTTFFFATASTVSGSSCSGVPAPLCSFRR